MTNADKRVGQLGRLPMLMSPHPDLCEFLLARHVARPDGRCRGCGSEAGPREWWPCRLYLAADEARRIATTAE